MSVYKGWRAKIYLDGSIIGLVESVTCEVTSGVEPYYEVGSRTPAALVEGNQEITGTITKAWVNNNILSLITGTGTLSVFDLVFKAANVTGAPWIYIYNCKLETGAIDIPQDGFLMEDYDFRGESIAVVTAP